MAPGPQLIPSHAVHATKRPPPPAGTQTPSPGCMSSHLPPWLALPPQPAGSCRQARAGSPPPPSPGLPGEDSFTCVPRPSELPSSLCCPGTGAAPPSPPASCLCAILEDLICTSFELSQKSFHFFSHSSSLPPQRGGLPRTHPCPDLGICPLAGPPLTSWLLCLYHTSLRRAGPATCATWTLPSVN